MRAVVLFGLSLIVSASALVEVQNNYHEAIGIPAAERIWENEQAILAKNAQSRIVGGILSPADVNPHYGALLINFDGLSRQSVCGSSLLTVSRILTAAHCWRDGTLQASQFIVVLGTRFLYHGGERIGTREVYVHPEYDVQFFTNDVAIGYLPRRATLRHSVQPIRLPTGSELESLFVGQWAVAVGFGKTSDEQELASLMVSHVSLQVIANDDCESVYGTALVKNSTLCTNGIGDNGGVGICDGDAGGPLAIRGDDRRNFLIGVSTFAAQGDCLGGHPSAFARVTSFYDWISPQLIHN